MGDTHFWREKKYLKMLSNIQQTEMQGNKTASRGHLPLFSFSAVASSYLSIVCLQKYCEGTVV